MSFFKQENKPESHFTTPRYPVHPLLDVVTGELMQCEKGDYVVNGGFSPHIAITGKGNANKTLIMLSIIMTFLIKHMKSGIDAQVLETENTLEYMRCMQIAMGMATIMGADDAQRLEIRNYVIDNFLLRTTKDISCNTWYDETDSICNDRIKSKKDRVTLPFRDIKSNPIEVINPHVAGIDSFSALIPDSVTANFIEKNTAGSSDNNTMYLREMNAKTQMLQNWLNKNPKSGVYMISSAHMGDKTAMIDQKAPPEKKNMFMKQNHSLKNVPEKYYFYTTTMLFVNSSSLLLAGDKTPYYDTSSKEAKDSRDILLEIIILRNKYGQSGTFIPLIANQNMGIDWHLSAFHYCKENGRWGFQGNDTNYQMVLRPDVALSRGKVRAKLQADPLLRRAVDITCEMYLLFKYKYDTMKKEYRCTPQELYDSLIDWGYDWDLLLSKRGHYTLDHYTNEVEPLSTYDLLRMRVGDYVPYWMTEDQIPQKVKDHMGITASKAAA